MTKIDEEALEAALAVAYERNELWAKTNGSPTDVATKAIITAYLTALSEEGYVIEQGWRPIETAPRDGTRVLLAVKSPSENNGWYGRNPPEVDGYEMFKWLGNGWSTPGSGGWADFFFSGWRPLPEPPLAARGE